MAGIEVVTRAHVGAHPLHTTRASIARPQSQVKVYTHKLSNSKGRSQQQCVLAAGYSRPRGTRCDVSSNQVDTSSYVDNFTPPRDAQKLFVYEINELDRQSPKYLRSSNSSDSSGNPVKGLGDLLPYTNKLYDGTLKTKLGITAGICIMIEYEPQVNGDRYECMFSAYFGELGHISVQGPYTSWTDCMMTVTGGTGIFTGVRGVVRCKTLLPTKLFYEYYLQGIQELPKWLTAKPVPPTLMYPQQQHPLEVY